MKHFWIFTFAFLLVGIYSITAQDLIVLRDGNIIEAKVLEISQTEIRYKRFDHLEGPTIVVPAANVLSIRYENGTSEIINAVPVPETQQPNTRTTMSENTAIDQDRFIFGINANAGGALGYAWGGSTGTGINIELGKGKFNSEINLMFPIGGFGILITFNGYWHSRIGGFYLGGGIGYIWQADSHDSREWCSGCNDYHGGIYDSHLNVIGLNIGYKFITSSGVYFRTGVFIAGGFDWASWDGAFFIKPDLAIGWTMK